MSKNFNKVYFIMQTTPNLQRCGYTFSKTEAKSIAKIVKLLTGKEGKIVEFSRQELKELKY